MNTSKAVRPIRTIVRYAILLVAVPIMLVAQTPTHSGGSWLAEAFAQNAGVIAACSSKGLLRIVGNAAECRSSETFVSLVTSDALDAVYARMAQMQQQNQNDLKEARRDADLAIGEMKKSLNTAISRLEADLEEADAEADAKWDASMAHANFALVVGILQGTIAAGFPPQQSSAWGSAWVAGLFADRSVVPEIRRIVEFLSCSQDTDNDGIPDMFYPCTQ